jgi:hypothetical protein
VVELLIECIWGNHWGVKKYCIEFCFLLCLDEECTGGFAWR